MSGRRRRRRPRGTGWRRTSARSSLQRVARRPRSRPAAPSAPPPAPPRATRRRRCRRRRCACPARRRCSPGRRRLLERRRRCAPQRPTQGHPRGTACARLRAAVSGTRGRNGRGERPGRRVRLCRAFPSPVARSARTHQPKRQAPWSLRPPAARPQQPTAGDPETRSPFPCHAPSQPRSCVCGDLDVGACAKERLSSGRAVRACLCRFVWSLQPAKALLSTCRTGSTSPSWRQAGPDVAPTGEKKNAEKNGTKLKFFAQP